MKAISAEKIFSVAAVCDRRGGFLSAVTDRRYSSEWRLGA